MSNKSEFKVALVGYGLAGAVFHAPLIKTTSGLKLSAIVTRSSEKQAQAKADFPGARVYAHFEQLLADKDSYDLAVIATPNKEHAKQAMQAMASGLAVVIDKPIAVNSAECKELIAESKRLQVPLTVFQNRRWDNDFLTLKKLISQGILGNILRFESRFERYRPLPRAGAWREKEAAELGGGILFDLGSHLIDQALQLFGKPEKIYAEIFKRREGVASDDDSFIALSFPQGVTAHLWMSAIAASQGHRFRLLGSKGAYEKYGLDPQEDALRAGMSPLAPEFGIEATDASGKLTLYPEGIVQERELPSEPGRYQEFYQAVYGCLAHGQPVPVDPADALLSLEIIEAAHAQAMKSSSN